MCCWTVNRLPTDFTSTPEDKNILDVWQRVRDPKSKDEPASSISGTWKHVSLTIAGRVSADPVDIEWTRVIKGQEEVIRRKTAMRGTLVLDASTTPRKIDWIYDQAAGSFAGRTRLGIYKLDGDSFTECSTLTENEERPVEFIGRLGRWVQFYKREKTHEETKSK